MKRFVLAFVVATCAACGGDNNVVGPTTTPTPTPTPQVRLTFTPETTAPAPSSLWIATGPRLTGDLADTVNIAIRAAEIAPITYVRGELRWDPALLEFHAWSHGEWFKQGNALVDWSFFNNTPGITDLFLTRPTSLPGASGSGDIIVFRFKPKAGVRSGVSPLQWSDPELRDSGFRDRPIRAYGGTITISSS